MIARMVKYPGFNVEFAVDSKYKVMTGIPWILLVSAGSARKS